jgi:23S rRNA pseudouridine1911/1915/1917 synthase
MQQNDLTGFDLVVPDDLAGQRLDRALASATGLSRTRIQEAIKGGAAQVDGKPARASQILEAGQRVTMAGEVAVVASATAGEAPVADAIPLRIRYEDDYLLVVDKPAGMVTHPAPGHSSGTLVNALLAHAPELADVGDRARPGIVHRLDKDTSGLLVIAKSEAAHRALQEAIRRRELRREYLALVEGCPPARRGTIDAPIGRDRRVRTRVSTDTDEPREARTRFELERALPGAALLRVTLETGRTHQIRVHLQAIGHPVAGDPEYGTPGRFGLRRQFLHAARLAFDHPLTGEPIDVRSPLPPDLAAVLERLSAEADARNA